MELLSQRNPKVYLVKAQASPQKYDEWLCGGAIVSPWFVITSAACVEDVQHLYVIAGYKKYVKTEKLNEDQCTKEMKKKVVFTCVPKLYELDYARVERWSLIDIAVIRVESAFDFKDTKYTQFCSYLPAMISVNYNVKFQDTGTDALIFGWGHARQWRRPGDNVDYNQEILNYAPVQIHDKNKCKSDYAQFKGMAHIIDKYMICTVKTGNMDENGEQILRKTPLADGCITEEEKIMGRQGVLCASQEDPNDYEKLNDEFLNFDETRRDLGSSETASGICQNDHGGPLITWAGSRETLIGVASVFRVDAKSHCVGPFLFTSTQCNGAFIACILEQNYTRRMDICDIPAKEKGFVTVETNISWINHPEGPADNEKNPLRPQIPIWEYEYDN